MRILLVAHGFPPKALGGTEIYTYGLAKAFQRRGHAVHVFFREGDAARPEYAVRRTRYQGIPGTCINNTWTQFADYSETYANPQVDAAFANVLDTFRPDVVHFCYLLCGLSAAMLAEAEARRVSTVVTLTDFHFMCPLGQLLTADGQQCEGPAGGVRCGACMPYLVDALVAKAYGQSGADGGAKALRFGLHWARRLTRLLPLSAEQTLALQQRLLSTYLALRKRLWPMAPPTQLDGAPVDTPLTRRDAYLKAMLSRSGLIVAPTKFLGDKFVQWGVPNDKAVYSEFGMDTELFQGYAHRPSPTLRFGFIGQMLPIKGVHVLLDAFSAFASCPDVELQVWADLSLPAAKDYLARMGELTKLPNLRFMGTFHHTRIAEVLSEIDVVIVPSLWAENSPLVLRNAILGRVPVIATNLGGMAPYVEDGRTGLLFEVGNVAQLRERMGRFVADRCLVEAFRANITGRTKTVDEDSSELEELYRSLPTCSHVHATKA